MYQTFEHRMRVSAPAPDVFPLLCPVRERDWVDGWQADIVRSSSGVAERGCVFRTWNADLALTWVVHAYEPPRHIGFTIVASDRFAELLTIDVSAEAAGTALRWRREITSLGAPGDDAVARRLEGWPHSHRWLERALEHYLVTGERLPR